MKVTHFHRKQESGFYSIERIFEDIRKNFNPNLTVKKAISRYPSQGFFYRFYNCLEAFARQGDINHITGDVHYLGYFFRKKTTILTIHDCVMMKRLNGVRRYIYWFFWLWLPVKRAGIVVAVSEATRDELIHYLGVRPSDIRIIYNGISDEFIFSRKNFNSALPVLLQIGTGPNKNLENLISAIKPINCKLHIIGILTDHQLNLLKIHHINYQVFSGLTRKQVVNQYCEADIVIFASTYEGFGLPILEANAIGRPVVTSDRSPMVEISGGAAVLVNPDDTLSIRMGIQKVLKDTNFRTQLIGLGIENAKRFSINATAKAYEELYRELIENFTHD